MTSHSSLICDNHYSDVIMSPMAFQITGVSIVCSTVCSGADQRKHQSSASLTFVRGIHRWPMDSSHKGPVTRKMFPFDDVIMNIGIPLTWTYSLLSSSCRVIQSLRHQSRGSHFWSYTDSRLTHRHNPAIKKSLNNHQKDRLHAEKWGLLKWDPTRSE